MHGQWLVIHICQFGQPHHKWESFNDLPNWKIPAIQLMTTSTRSERISSIQKANVERPDLSTRKTVCTTTIHIFFITTSIHIDWKNVHLKAHTSLTETFCKARHRNKANSFAICWSLQCCQLVITAPWH